MQQAHVRGLALRGHGVDDRAQNQFQHGAADGKDNRAQRQTSVGRRGEETIREGEEPEAAKGETVSQQGKRARAEPVHERTAEQDADQLGDEVEQRQAAQLLETETEDRAQRNEERRRQIGNQRDDQHAEMAEPDSAAGIAQGDAG